MIGVAITADSRREWSCGATRYNWIVAPGWTDVEIKKSRLSLVARLLSDLFLPDDLRSHKPTHWSVWAFQQRLAQSESRLSEQYICLSSWQLLVLLLILLLGQLRLHMSRPEGRRLWRPRQEIFRSATEPKWAHQGVFRLTDINPIIIIISLLVIRQLLDIILVCVFDTLQQTSGCVCRQWQVLQKLTHNDRQVYLRTHK